MSESEQQQGKAPSKPAGAFSIAGWIVDPATDRIACGDKTIQLEPKVMQVLEYLARHPGQVVSREELEATVWSGRVVGYDAVTNAIIKLRKAFNDDPKRPRIIETLSKKGYRLVAPVHLVPEPAGAAQTGGSDLPSVRSRSRWSRTGVVVLLIILLATAGALFMFEPWRATDDTADKGSTLTSIAVLPFTNLSGDPEQEYFVDGMTDDLITDLSKISGLFVSARSAVFAYKGTPVNIQDVSQALGVRYVLEGSVRKSGQTLRITAQLVDATTGFELWAERFDRNLKDVFALQDEITAKIVSALEVKLTRVEHQKLARRYTDNLEAYDYFLRGLELYGRRSKEDNLSARELFEKATQVDPNFAWAYAGLANTYASAVINGWSDAPERSLERGYEVARKAIALDDLLPQAHFAMARLHRERRELEQAAAEAKKAVELEPNYADAYVLLGAILIYAGKPEDGLKMIQKAIHLNPQQTARYHFHRGQAYFTLGRYKEAIDVFERGLERYPGSQRLRVWLIASYAHMGRQEDAKWEGDQLLVADPKFSVKRLEQIVPYKDRAHLERLIDGLRKAGLPE